jgi:hypothetical protein
VEALSPLAAWESFYVIAGSSGGALTGLQFVVMALVADTRRDSTKQEIEAFGSPTVVHFCMVLLVSGILSAPWPTITGVAIALGLCGLLGIGYTLVVVYRTTHQQRYKPVLEDWLFHCLLPLLAYIATLAGALELEPYPTVSLFVVAGAVLLLLFIGIHNSWDTVTFVVIERPAQGARAEPKN